MNKYFGKIEQIFLQERNKSLCNVYKNIVIEREQGINVQYEQVFLERENKYFRKRETSHFAMCIKILLLSEIQSINVHQYEQVLLLREKKIFLQRRKK